MGALMARKDLLKGLMAPAPTGSAGHAGAGRNRGPRAGAEPPAAALTEAARIGAVGRSIADARERGRSSRSTRRPDRRRRARGPARRRRRGPCRAGRLARATTASRCRCWCGRIPTPRAATRSSMAAAGSLALRDLWASRSRRWCATSTTARWCVAQGQENTARRGSELHREGELRPADGRGRLRPEGDLRRAVDRQDRDQPDARRHRARCRWR